MSESNYHRMTLSNEAKNLSDTISTSSSNMASQYWSPDNQPTPNEITAQYQGDRNTPVVNPGSQEAGGMTLPWLPANRTFGITDFASGSEPPKTTVAVPRLPNGTGYPTFDMVRNAMTKQQRYSVTGTFNAGGYIIEEDFPLLQGRNAAIVYDNMIRSDYQVATVLRHINNAIKAATWSYEAGEPGDEQSELIAEYVEWCLFEDLLKSFPDNLSDMISFLPFGYSMFEPTWKATKHIKFGDCWNLYDLGFISQKTIWRWKVIADHIWSVQQLSYFDESVVVEIPGDEILTFINERTGNNYQGISIIRAAFGPYFRKQEYHKMLAIGIERSALGVPIVTTDRDITGTPEDENLNTMMMNFALGNQPYLKFVKGITCQMEQIPFKAEEIMQVIKAEDISIAKSVMQEFVELGSTVQTGSRALAQPKIEDFKSSLKYIVQTIDYGLRPWVKQLVNLKFGPQEKYPILRVDGIEEVGLELSETMKNFADGGIIEPDDALEAHIRDIYNLPEKDNTTVRKKAPITPVPESKITPEGMSEKHNHKQLKEKHVRRQLTEYEAKVKFTEMEKDMKDYNKQFTELATEWLKKVLNKYKIDLGNKLSHSADTAKGKMDAIGKTELSYNGQYKDAVAEFIEKVVKVGRSQAIGEIKKGKKLAEFPTVNDLPPSINGWVKINSKIATDTQLNKLFSKVSIAALKAQTNGGTDEDIVSEADSVGNGFIGNVNNLGSGIITNMAINEGRKSVFDEAKDEIQGFQFSALLENSCDFCEELDGSTFSIDDSDSQEYTPPCHPQCQCVLIPILLDEKTPEWDGLDDVAENKFTKEDIDKYNVLSELPI